MSKNKGQITSVQGNMITVAFDGDIIQNEVGYVLTGADRLMAEVIRISANIAYMQVFEDTKGIKIGDEVAFSSEMLSVKLGPGLLGQVYDGLQNPLPQLAEKFGFFLPRGVHLPPLDEKKKWEFTPLVKAKTKVTKGTRLGFVTEGIFKHYIIVTFNLEG